MKKLMKVLGTVLLVICMAFSFCACLDDDESSGADGGVTDGVTDNVPDGSDNTDNDADNTQGGTDGDSDEKDDGKDDGDKQEENISIIFISSDTYADVEKAVKGYLDNEITYTLLAPKGSMFFSRNGKEISKAEYIGHESKGAVTTDKIDTDDERRDGIVSAEKIAVKAKLTSRPFDHMELDGVDDLVEDIEQTVCVAKYGESEYRYMVPAPIVGERATNSYFKLLQNPEPYMNSTVTESWTMTCYALEGDDENQEGEYLFASNVAMVPSIHGGNSDKMYYVEKNDINYLANVLKNGNVSDVWSRSPLSEIVEGFVFDNILNIGYYYGDGSCVCPANFEFTDTGMMSCFSANAGDGYFEMGDENAVMKQTISYVITDGKVVSKSSGVLFSAELDGENTDIAFEEWTYTITYGTTEVIIPDNVTEAIDNYIAQNQ